MDETYSCRYCYDKTSVQQILHRKKARQALLFLFCKIRILLHRNVGSRCTSCAKTPFFGQPLVTMQGIELIWGTLKCQGCFFKGKPFYKRTGLFFLILFHPASATCYKEIFDFICIDLKGKHLCSVLLQVMCLLSCALKKSYQH